LKILLIIQFFNVKTKKMAIKLSISNTHKNLFFQS
jgi:hypothetical protein